MFKPCVIVPVYNHHKKIAEVVEQIVLLGLPCMILDDGSRAECARVLTEVAAAHKTVSLKRFAHNRGKGAVVCDGLRQMHEAGFTHALQIDADGQHDLADVPAFLEIAQRNPRAVVCGRRDYQQMPPSRRYGRLVTDLWVWINTLSSHIKDSMCGYRLYPLASTAQLLSSSRICRRMDFDTDILVRLYWRGVDVEHVDTAIRYDDEIVSHFNLLRDNLRISLMHARLFCGMIIRIPSLITRYQRKKEVSVDV